MGLPTVAEVKDVKIRKGGTFVQLARYRSSFLPEEKMLKGRLDTLKGEREKDNTPGRNKNSTISKLKESIISQQLKAMPPKDS